MDSQTDGSREQSDGAIVLGLLDAVERGGVTQRSLSRELGIAVGLVNIYVKRCINKGLIKVQEIPHRRYSYYVTPQGFIEKSRLLATYFTSSLDFFRRARAACEDSLLKAAAAEQRRIALVGANELAEIAIVVAIDIGVEIVAVVDADLNKPRFVGVPVTADLAAAAKIADAALVTSMSDPQALFESAVAAFGRERVYMPSVLSLVLANRRRREAVMTGEKR
jgi:DNA-binding MarR family transcriptional regulator